MKCRLWVQWKLRYGQASPRDLLRVKWASPGLKFFSPGRLTCLLDRPARGSGYSLVSSWNGEGNGVAVVGLSCFSMMNELKFSGCEPSCPFRTIHCLNELRVTVFHKSSEYVDGPGCDIDTCL